MNRSSLFRFSAVAVPFAAALTVLAIYACSDGTAPSGHTGGRTAAFALNPVFQTAGPPGIVQFVKVRVILHRTDGTVALDTLVDFPSDASEITLQLHVALSELAGASGEDFVLNLEMLNAAGDVVFRGGPMTLHATEGAPPLPVDIPTTYSGPGATATGVTLNPSAVTVLPGATVDFTATAFDASGASLPGTPVQFSSLDPTIATVPNPLVGRAIAGASRGTAHIHAVLVTGQSADAVITVRPAPSVIVRESGNGQTGAVGTALPLPLRAKVLATDGVGTDGVQVTFAITSGGGTLGALQVTTDNQGIASATLTLGNTPGPVTVTASATGLSGSPITFAAISTAGPASQVVFQQQPADGIAMAPLAPVVVQARDAFGNPATTYTGTVTLALDAPPAGVSLQGTLSVAAVAGIATFSDLRVSAQGSGLRLRASGVDVTGGATSNSFTIGPAPATHLAITVPPTSTQKTGAPVHIVVEARNAQDGVATQQTGVLSISLVSGPVGSNFTGANQVPFVAGVAAFNLTFNKAGVYQLALAAVGLPGLVSQPFIILSSGTTRIEIVSGADQTAPASTLLPEPLVVAVIDGEGVPISGISVIFTVVLGGGSVSPTSAVTDASGRASTRWTLGPSGVQRAQASHLALSPAVFNATLPPLGSIARTWVGNVSSDWADAANWLPSGVPGPLDDVLIPACDCWYPYLTLPTTIHNLVLAANVDMTIAGVDLAVTGNLTLGAGAWIETSGPPGLKSNRAAVRGNGSRTTGARRAPPRRGPRTAALGIASVYSYGTLTLSGTSSIITAGVEALISPDVYMQASVSMASDVGFGGSVYVQSPTGLLTIGGFHASVDNDFVTIDGGRLSMANAAGVLEVFFGTVSFEGGSTSGLLTAGELLVHGDFSQYGGAGLSFGAVGGETPAERHSRIMATVRIGTSGPAALRRAPQPVPMMSARDKRVAALRAPLRTPRGTRPAPVLPARLTRASLRTNVTSPSPTSFAPSGTHVTRFAGGYCDCSVDGYIYFDTPGTSHFRNVVFDTGTWSPDTDIQVTNNMSVINGASVIGAVGYYESGMLGGFTVLGIVSVDATSSLAPSWLAITHDPVGDGYIAPDMLELDGPSHVLSLTTNPGLMPGMIDVYGHAQLVPGETMTLPYNVLVAGTGVFKLNGGHLVSSWGTFVTVESGVLMMNGAADVLDVYGASFQGGASVVTAGEIKIRSWFEQSTTANAFAASGTNVVTLASSWGGIYFEHPGTDAASSHFMNVSFSGASTMWLESAVYVNGVFSASAPTDTLATITLMAGGSGYTISVQGLDVSGAFTYLVFDNTRLALGPNAPVTAFNNVTFQNFTSANADYQFTMARNGGTYTFNNIQFTTLCADTYGYAHAYDADDTGAAPSFVFVSSSIPDPVGCSAKVVADSPATIIGLPQPVMPLRP